MAMKIDTKSALFEEETLEAIQNDLSVLQTTSDSLPQEQQALLQVIQSALHDPATDTAISSSSTVTLTQVDLLQIIRAALGSLGTSARSSQSSPALSSQRPTYETSVDTAPTLMPEPVNEGSNKLINVLEDGFSGLQNEFAQFNVGLQSLKQELGDMRSSFARSNNGGWGYTGGWGSGGGWGEDRPRNDTAKVAKGSVEGKQTELGDSWGLSTAETTSADASLCYIHRLPSEVLGRILAAARNALHFDTQGWGRAYSVEELLHMNGAQKWLLETRTVARPWDIVALTLAFKDMYIQHEKSLKRVTQHLAELVQGTILNPRPVSAKRSNAVPNDSWDASRQGYEDAWGVWHDTIPGSGEFEDADFESKPIDADEKTAKPAAVDKIVQFFAVAPHLQDLILIGTEWARPSKTGDPFLHRGFHAALCKLKLRSLQMMISLAFADVELLLQEIVTLEELRLPKGIQDLLGGDIIPAEDHHCRLRYLELGGYGAPFFIGSAQLCWLLGPSAGHMKNLHLSLKTPASFDNGHVPHEFLNLPPQFATRLFADVLTQLAPTLEKLHLRYAGGFFGNQVDQALQEAPHLGSLDYALSHCRMLRSISLHWTLTSSQFLDSLSNCPELLYISMEGTSQDVSAMDFINAIKQMGFPNLRSIDLHQFHRGLVPVTWGSRDLRELYVLCEDLGIGIHMSK